MPLQASFRAVDPHTAVVTLTGSLTLGTNLKTADMQLQAAIEQGTTRLVLEMSGVPYMDSAGLGALVHACGLARAAGGDLRLCGVAPRVAELLHMTRVNALLQTDADEPAALAALAG